MGTCSVTAKCVMFVLGTLFLLAAAGLTYVSVSIIRTYHDYEHIDEDYYTLIPASILLGAAIFMVITGALGCCGACKENKCILGTFFTLILLILLLEVTAAILGFVYKDDIKSGIEKGMETAVNNYTKTEFTDSVDEMQEKLHCCGVDNYTDWIDTTWGKENPGHVPKSCCKEEAKNCTAEISKPDQIYTEGCYDKLFDTLESNLKYIMIAGAVFAFIMIAGMVFACVLICTRKEIPYINLDSGEYRA